jgi:hypothetical protein
MEEAMTEAELAIVRRAYAKQVMAPFKCGPSPRRGGVRRSAP